MATLFPKNYDPTVSTRKLMASSTLGTNVQDAIEQTKTAGVSVPVIPPVKVSQPTPAPVPATVPQAQYSVDDVGKRLRASNPDAFQGFTDAQIGERAIQRKPELASLVQPAAPAAEPKQNIAQQIFQPVTDFLATGYRTAESVPGLLKGVGQTIIGDKEGGAKTILDAGRDVEKSVNIPLLGQGNIRKIGTVDDKGFIKPSSETVKSLGTAAELASFVAPTSKIAAGTKLLPRVAVRGTEGALIGGLSEAGRNLRETGSAANVPKSALMGALGGGLAGGALGAGGLLAEKTGNKLTQGFNAPAIASRAVNSVIKPLSKQFQFGKNPGATIAKFKIVGNNFEQLGERVGAAKNQVGEQIRSILQSTENAAKTMDITPALKPIDEAIQRAAETGDQAIFNKLRDLRERITTIFRVDDGKLTPTQTRNLSNVTPEQATDVKRLVGDMVRWTEQKTEDDITNGALYKIYGNIKKEVERVVPEIKELNADYGGLLEAEKAIAYRDKIAQRLNLVSLPGTMMGVGGAIMSLLATGGAAAPAILTGASGVAIDKALKSPAVMTRLGAWLSKTPVAEKQRILMEFPLLRNAIIKAFGIQAVESTQQETAP